MNIKKKCKYQSLYLAVDKWNVEIYSFLCKNIQYINDEVSILRNVFVRGWPEILKYLLSVGYTLDDIMNVFNNSFGISSK